MNFRIFGKATAPQCEAGEERQEVFAARYSSSAGKQIGTVVKIWVAARFDVLVSGAKVSAKKGFGQ